MKLTVDVSVIDAGKPGMRRGIRRKEAPGPRVHPEKSYRKTSFIDAANERHIAYHTQEARKHYAEVQRIAPHIATSKSGAKTQAQHVAVRLHAAHLKAATLHKHAINSPDYSAKARDASKEAHNLQGYAGKQFPQFNRDAFSIEEKLERLHARRTGDADEARTTAFNQLANAQRGHPEHAMLKAQNTIGGGVMSHAIEHTGDLTHRMAQRGGAYGSEYVAPKVRSVLSSIQHKYGFEREHNENMKSNKAAPEVAKKALEAYSAEHAKLPVYNAMQEHARNAAIHLGRGNYKQVEHHLTQLHSAIKSRKFDNEAMKYDPDYPGKVYKERPTGDSGLSPHAVASGADTKLSHDPQYVYHATNHERLHDIAASGKLAVHRPGDYTDQKAWPDGKTEKRAYFGAQAKHTIPFAPEEGKVAMLRTKKHPDIKQERGTPDLYTTKSIPANRLEYLHTSGAWHPLRGTIDSREDPWVAIKPGSRLAIASNSDVKKLSNDDWSEKDHPRGQPENAGEFASVKGQRQQERQMLEAGNTQGEGKEKQRFTATGEKLPLHIQKLGIPPAWTKVRYNPDPSGDLLATGVDAKGRSQRLYSSRFAGTQAEAKFRRIQELDNNFTKVVQQNQEMRFSNNPRVRDAADCAHLVMTMGVRPGSETDTQARLKAYGATTLLGQHVVEEGGKTFLRFTGKSGKSLNLPVDDADTAKMLRIRAKHAGADGSLFGISERALLAHVKGIAGGSFKTKDFRTLIGTRTALHHVKAVPTPKDEKEYKKAVLEVATLVSKKLGNTPAVALQSYINPVAFASWRMGVEGTHAHVGDRMSVDSLGSGRLPQVYFGSVDAKPMNWRHAKPDSRPDDDALLAVTPPDVVALLGFDPLDVLIDQRIGFLNHEKESSK